ncbi:hypothetical protein PoB_007547200 [Plakobranchus ocellatus]|uniref:Uncharacterized protein n=1 Tax=Plakobranchus ocellatus TaxID=259542 RepID=A0AAV4DY64_9GAST|nr:hypothetical protein PoB_007547200 [Plakobranchus ocellatus]
MMSGFQALRQPRVPVAKHKPAIEGPCRSHGRFATTVPLTPAVRIIIKLSPQQGDLRLSGPPSGQGDGGGARARDRKVPADFRADSLATVPPTPLQF